MTWARHASPTIEQGRFAEARASEKIHYAVQNRKAARTVAYHSSDAQDCANLLAMLGLDTLGGDSHSQSTEDEASYS